MPEAIAAPPPKPAPSPPPTRPSSPPPRPPSPKPAPPKPEESGAFDDAFADLDKIEAKDADSKAPRKQDKKQTQKDERKSSEEDSEEDNASDVEEVSQDEAKPDKPKDDEQNGGNAKKDSEAEPKTNPELRAAHAKSKATIKERETEIARLKTELESKSKSVDPEKATLVERLATTEKKLKEYEDEIRFTNYKNHPEFKEKFEDPYHGAFKKALADFEQIHVTDDEGNKRLATRVDLDSMLRMSIAQVDELATEKFGHSAARVIRHVEKLRDLADAYHGALEEAKTKGGEREKNKLLQEQQQNEQRHKAWTDENDAVTKKYPHWFSPKEGDDEANTALEKGYKLADTVFLRRDQESPEKLVKMDAAVRNKAAGFDRLVLESKRKDAKIAELEKALKEFEASDPDTEGDEPPKNNGGGNWQDSADAELDAIERKMRQ